MITAKHPRTGQVLCTVERACSGLAWSLTEAQADWLQQKLGTERPTVRFLGRDNRYISSRGHRKLINQSITLDIGGHRFNVWRNGYSDQPKGDA